jgi:hypothetical protein
MRAELYANHGYRIDLVCDLRSPAPKSARYDVEDVEDEENGSEPSSQSFHRSHKALGLKRGPSAIEKGLVRYLASTSQYPGYWKSLE